MNNDLISVIVHAYNSADTIIDTLESIKRQSYSRIELIVSDDASTDNTVEITKRWLVQNNYFFEKSTVVKHKSNMGITKHLTESVKLAHGKWIKTIAGDDMLCDDCIDLDICFVKNHPNCEFLVTNMYLFDDHGKWDMPPGERAYCNYLGRKNPEVQYKMLLKRDVHLSPSEFFSADIFRKYGEPRNPSRNIEDWPFRLHVAGSGCKIYYLDKNTVCYRMGVSSVSRIKDHFFNPNHLENRRQIEKELVYPHIKKTDIVFWWNEIIKHFRFKTIIWLGNKPDRRTSLINRGLLIIQPYTYQRLFWSVIGKIYYRSGKCK